MPTGAPGRLRAMPHPGRQPPSSGCRAQTLGPALPVLPVAVGKPELPGRAGLVPVGAGPGPSIRVSRPIGAECSLAAAWLRAAASGCMTPSRTGTSATPRSYPRHGRLELEIPGRARALTATVVVDPSPAPCPIMAPPQPPPDSEGRTMGGVRFKFACGPGAGSASCQRTAA